MRYLGHALALVTVLGHGVARADSSAAGYVDTSLGLRAFGDPGGAFGAPSLTRFSLRQSFSELGAFDSAQVVMLGFGQAQLGDDTFFKNNADISLLYAQAQKGRLRVSVGRQMLASLGGGANLRAIDGVHLRHLLSTRTEVVAYAGTEPYRRARQKPLRTHLGAMVRQHGLRWSAGARVDHPLQKHRGTEVGAMGDLHLGQLYLQSFADYDLQARAFREAEIAAQKRWQSLWLRGDVHYTDPKLFLARESGFWVFGGQPQLAPGLSLHYQPSPFFRYGVLAKAWQHLGGEDGGTSARQSLGYMAELDARTFREVGQRSFVGIGLGVFGDGLDTRARARIYTHLALNQKNQVGAEANVEFRRQGSDIPSTDAQNSWATRLLLHGARLLPHGFSAAATLGLQQNSQERFALFGQMHLRYALGTTQMRSVP